MHDTAAVTVQEVIEWATRTGMTLPATNRMRAINEARRSHRLPEFRIIAAARGEAADPPGTLRKAALAAIAESQGDWNAAREHLYARVRNRAELLWEMLAPYRTQAAQTLLAEAAGTLRPAASCGHGPDPEPAPRPVAARRTAQSIASAAQAAAEAAQQSLLDTFKVNGRPLGKVTAGEAREWARSKTVAARFVRLMAEGIPAGEAIERHRSAGEAAAFLARATAESADAR